MARASREFQIFAKPAGAACNLDCRYCYYLPKKALYSGEASLQMPEDILEAYIVQHLQAHPGPVVQFSWHGGEPTLLGQGYFRRIVELQRKHRPAGRRVVNGIQTNGTLLDDDWCRFLAEAGFAVGLSLDGPPEMHDRYRVARGGRPTFERALRAYSCLRRHRVRCDILCVVHAHNVRHPGRVYQFFKEIETPYIGFLPLVEPRPATAGGVSARTAPAEALGDFFCGIFDEWKRRDMGRVIVQLFEEAAAPAFGREQALCIFRETCGDLPALEHNGDLYACDHFVSPAHQLGNIRETPLAVLLESPAQRAFGRAKQDALPRYCRECEVRFMCNGGCPKDRILRTPDGEAGLNYLCAAYKRFFTYCRPFFEDLADLCRMREDVFSKISNRNEF